MPLQVISGSCLCAAFLRFSDGGKIDLTQQKLVFVLLHLVSLGIALYKVSFSRGSGPRTLINDGDLQCQGLGLLPTTVSDWATFETVARVSATCLYQSRRTLTSIVRAQPLQFSSGSLKV